LVLDTAWRGAAGEEARPGEAEATWLVWPDAERPVLVLSNQDGRAPVRIARVGLEELDDGSWAPETRPAAGNGRTLALDLTGCDAVARFGAGGDAVSAARHLAAYARLCGTRAVVLDPAAIGGVSAGDLGGQGPEDPSRAARLGVLLDVLGREGLGVLLECRLDGPLPGLPAPGSDEAVRRGLAVLGPDGRPVGEAYSVLHQEVQAALRARVVGMLASYPGLLGLVVRLGPEGTLPGRPAAGLDDETFERFVRANFAESDGEVPGTSRTAPERFAARAAFVEGAGRTAGVGWRWEQRGRFYGELAAGVKGAVPGGVLLVVTPSLGSGPAAVEARRVDREGLTADQAWLALGLDPRRWPEGPVLVRGVELDAEGACLDPDASPELDALVASRSRRGACLAASHAGGPGLRLAARTLAADQPLGHAMAVLDPEWVLVSGVLAAGQEARLGRFARVLGALPVGEGPPVPRLESGVAVRSWIHGGRTYVAFANDTPYEVLQAAVVGVPVQTQVDDLGRGLRLQPRETEGGGQEVVMRLPAFGVAAVRVAAPEATVRAASTYLPAMAELEERADGLSTRLADAGALEALLGPPMPGFEPSVAVPAAGEGAPLLEVGGGVEVPPLPLPAPEGWGLRPGGGGAVVLDAERPRSGRAALRLDAEGESAAVESGPFLPPGGDTLMVRSWLRSSPAGRVRLRVEGRSGEATIRRAVELPVSTEWGERVVRVPGLPAEGLDGLRLAYEWLGPAPGTLWVDDVQVTGKGPSEPVRRARRTLMEALQAYRARRYADFARLLGSQRVRTASLRLWPGDDAGALRTGRASDTDLPSGRRLR
jgi:hypothetical protein